MSEAPSSNPAHGAASPDPSNPAAAPVGQTVGRGLAWVLLSFSASKLVGVALTVALGYLLKPEEMGTWAATLGVFGFMQSCRDAGVATLLVQRGEREYASLIGPAFWLSTSFHVFAAMLVVVIGLTMLLHIPGKEEIGRTLMYCSAALVAMAPGTIAQARLRMKLSFRTISTITAISALVRAVVVLTGAILGAGAISFALGLLCLGLFESIAMSIATKEKLWAHPAQPSRWPSLIWTVRWSLAITFSLSLLAVGDWAALSLTASASVIGIYYFGVQLMMQAEQAIAGTAAQVLFPTFSSLQNDQTRLASAFHRVLRALSLLSSPATLALGLLADPLIRFVWPSGRWDESILCLTALTLLASFRICFVAPFTLLQGQGKFRGAFAAMATAGGTLFLSALLGGLLFGDPLKIAICTGGLLGPVCLLVTMIVAKQIGLARRKAFTGIVRPWLVAATIAIALFLLDRWAMPEVSSRMGWTTPPREAHLARLIISGSLFALLYAIAARIVLAEVLQDAISIAPARVRPLAERILRLQASETP